MCHWELGIASSEVVICLVEDHKIDGTVVWDESATVLLDADIYRPPLQVRQNTVFIMLTL